MSGEPVAICLGTKVVKVPGFEGVGEVIVECLATIRGGKGVKGAGNCAVRTRVRMVGEGGRAG